MRKIIFSVGIAMTLTCQVASAEKKESQYISSSKKTITASLKDPDSVKFRGIYMASEIITCGYVNAKNSYGGYAGFKRFYVLVGVADSIDDGGEGFNQAWESFCVKKS